MIPGLIHLKRNPSGQLLAAPSRTPQPQGRANRGNAQAPPWSTLSWAEDSVQWGIASGLMINRDDCKDFSPKGAPSTGLRGCAAVNRRSMTFGFDQEPLEVGEHLQGHILHQEMGKCPTNRRGLPGVFCQEVVKKMRRGLRLVSGCQFDGPGATAASESDSWPGHANARARTRVPTMRLEPPSKCWRILRSSSRTARYPAGSPRSGSDGYSTSE